MMESLSKMRRLEHQTGYTYVAALKKIKELETQLAEAQADAQLARALRSIVAAGYDYILTESEIDIHRYKDDSRTIIRAATDVEAAEEAELWITEQGDR